MVQLLVNQLRFARSELLRCLEGLSEEDAVRRVMPMNCISWMVGHIADQEHVYWVVMAQEQNIAPDLYKLVGFGRPATTPPFKEMLETWRAVTSAADQYLDTLTVPQLETFFDWRGKPVRENIGTMLLRNIDHYWFHIGEAHAVRQVLGHTNLPDFVGPDMPPYLPEA